MAAFYIKDSWGSIDHRPTTSGRLWVSCVIHARAISGQIKRIQFFKQGPAYKKEGPDPNKGSNHQ